MPDYYVLLKTIHILSATVLIGMGAGIAFFCWFGYRRALAANDIGALRVTLALTVRADAIFTGPAVVVQFASGALLIERLGWSWSSPWVLSAIALFVFVGVCWLPVVRLQQLLAADAAQAETIAALGPRFHQRFRVWFALGIPAFASVVFLVYFMVAKPLSVFG